MKNRTIITRIKKLLFKASIWGETSNNKSSKSYFKNDFIKMQIDFNQMILVKHYCVLLNIQIVYFKYVKLSKLTLLNILKIFYTRHCKHISAYRQFILIFCAPKMHHKIEIARLFD